MATQKPIRTTGLAIVAVVAVAGFTVWYQARERELPADTRPAEAQGEGPGRSPGAEPAPAPDERDPLPAVQRDIEPLEPGTLIRAGDGLAFEPARIGSRFIGYRVLANTSDPRFEIGDIIVSIAGSPVEDSPAGSELFLASLSNRGAAVQLHESGTDP